MGRSTEDALRSRRCLPFQRRRAAGPHLPYPSSPRGRGGNKEEALLSRVFLPSLPRGERGRGSEGRRRGDAENEGSGGDLGDFDAGIEGLDRRFSTPYTVSSRRRRVLTTPGGGVDPCIQPR